MFVLLKYKYKYNGGYPMYDKIPSFLKELDIWLCYDERQTENKAPRDLKGKLLKGWSRKGYNFKQCIDSIKQGYNTGLGIVLKSNSGIVCIDYDNCLKGIEENKDLQIYKPLFNSKSSEKRILRDINNIQSYTEISPSGKGIHIYLIANTSINTKTDKIEIYTKKYIRMTGILFNEFLDFDIEERTEQLENLLKEYKLDKDPTIKYNVSKSKDLDNAYYSILCDKFKLSNKYTDAEIKQTMFKSKKGKILEKLYNNTITDKELKDLKIKKDNIDTSNSGKAITLIMNLLDFSYGDIKAVKRIFKDSALCKKDYLDLKYANQTRDKIDYCFIPFAIRKYHNYRNDK